MKKILLIVFVIAAALSLAACGKAETQEQAPAEKTVLKVGTEPSFAPFEYKDETTGEITGFDIDLIKAIAEDQGFEVEIQNLGFDGLIMALQTGNIDIVASGMTITPEREKEVDFTAPYINAGLALVVAESNTDIASVDDLKGKKVAVQIGTTGAQKAQELLDAGKISEVKTLSTCDLIMMELVNGGVDAVINDLPVTEAYITKQPGKVKMVGEPLTSESYGFAVRKDNKELLEKLNTGLKNVIDNGKFAEIQAKYFQ